METDDVDKGILRRVQRKEREVIRNISWISIGIAFLYMCGYAWRAAYYGRLGIPESFIDFPFPEILIPKPRLLVFIAQFVLIFLYAKYRRLYQEEKRRRRAKKMGIDGPLDVIAGYGARKNAHVPSGEGKTNHEVFYEFLGRYLKEKTKDDQDWKFDRDEFEREVLKLFPDIPRDIERGFVSYELQCLRMNNKELWETVSDSVGALPQGSDLFVKLNLYLLYAWAIGCVVGIIWYGIDTLWTVIFTAAGVGMGYALYRISENEDRYQLWQMIWVCIFVAVILNGLDGNITARSDLARIRFPIATIVRTDGTEYKGLLLATFADNYVIAPVPHDANAPYKLVRFHNSSVSSVEFTTFGWLDQYIRKTREELQRETGSTLETLRKPPTIKPEVGVESDGQDGTPAERKEDQRYCVIQFYCSPVMATFSPFGYDV